MIKNYSRWVRILRGLVPITACLIAAYIYWQISHNNVQKQIGVSSGGEKGYNYWSKIDDISLVSYLHYDSPVRIFAKQIHHDGDQVAVFEPMFALDDALEFKANQAKFQRLENLITFYGAIHGKYQGQYFIDANDIQVELDKKLITSSKPLEIYNQYQRLTSSAGFHFAYDKKIMYLNGDVILHLKGENATITSVNAEYVHEKNQAVFLNAKLITKDKVELTADRMLVEGNNNFSASGHVHFTNKEYNITSDQAQYNKVSGVITMHNNISIVRNGSKIEGKEFIFDLAKKQAKMNNGGERVKATISE